MRFLIFFYILACAVFANANVFDKLFGGYNYGYQQQPPTDYGYNYGYQQQPPTGYGYQQQPYYTQRSIQQPKQQQRSYNDICRVINANGFTNPGGVPKCHH